MKIHLPEVLQQAEHHQVVVHPRLVLLQQVLVRRQAAHLVALHLLVQVRPHLVPLRAVLQVVLHPHQVQAHQLQQLQLHPLVLLADQAMFHLNLTIIITMPMERVVQIYNLPFYR